MVKINYNGVQVTVLSPEAAARVEAMNTPKTKTDAALKTPEPSRVEWLDALEEARRAVSRLSDHANDMRYMKEFYEVNRAWHILFNLPCRPESDGASIGEAQPLRLLRKSFNTNRRNKQNYDIRKRE